MHPSDTRNPSEEPALDLPDALTLFKAAHKEYLEKYPLILSPAKISELGDAAWEQLPPVGRGPYFKLAEQARKVHRPPQPTPNFIPSPSRRVQGAVKDDYPRGKAARTMAGRPAYSSSTRSHLDALASSPVPFPLFSSKNPGHSLGQMPHEIRHIMSQGRGVCSSGSANPMQGQWDPYPSSSAQEPWTVPITTRVPISFSSSSGGSHVPRDASIGDGFSGLLADALPPDSADETYESHHARLLGSASPFGQLPNPDYVGLLSQLPAQDTRTPGISDNLGEPIDQAPPYDGPRFQYTSNSYMNMAYDPSGMLGLDQLAPENFYDDTPHPRIGFGGR